MSYYQLKETISRKLSVEDTLLSSGIVPGKGHSSDSGDGRKVKKSAKMEERQLLQSPPPISQTFTIQTPIYTVSACTLGEPYAAIGEAGPICVPQ